MSTILKFLMTKFGRTFKKPAHISRLKPVRVFIFLSAVLCLNRFLLHTVKKQVSICGSVIEASKKSDAVVIATEWKEFKEIDWETIYKDMNKPAFVFDGRLLLDADKLRKIGFKVCVFLLAWEVYRLGWLNRLQLSDGRRPPSNALPNLSIWNFHNLCPFFFPRYRPCILLDFGQRTEYNLLHVCIWGEIW